MSLPKEIACLNEKALRDWAERYEKNLSLFASDLELIIEKKHKIIVALDFHDILSYLVPQLRINKSSDTIEKNIEIKREIARGSLFSKLKIIYNLPIILLPPYLSESIHYFNKAEFSLFKLIDEDYKRIIIDKLDNAIESLKNDCAAGSSFSYKLGDDIFELALFYSPYFMDGVKGFRNMREENIIGLTPGMIKNFLEILSTAREKDNNELYMQFRAIRPKKLIQNLRDSKAIQYTIEINNNVEDPCLLMLASGAAVFIAFRMTNKSTEKYIEGQAYQFLRDIDSFYLPLVKLLHLSILDAKSDIILDEEEQLNQEELKFLYKYVKEELLLLRSFRHAFENLSPELIEGIKRGAISGKRYLDLLNIVERLGELKEVIEKVEAKLMMEFISRNKINLENCFNNEETGLKLVSLLIQFRTLLGSNEFYSELLNRISVLDEEYLKYENYIYDILGIFAPLSDTENICNLAEWKLSDLNKEILDSIEKRDFGPFNELIEHSKIRTLNNPDMIILNDDKYLIYDKKIKNEVIYIINLKRNKQFNLSRIDMNYVYLALIKIYKRTIKQESSLVWLQNCGIIKILDIILPHQQAVNFHKYDIINEFYNNIKLNL
jgi:hypothetical protein